jgi:ribose transport system ATP-binding protein
MTLTSTELLLDATGIAKTYGAVVALKSASLAIRPGEVHALMGANGAGKSTLVKILTGAVRPDAGRIAIRGRDRPANSPGDARRNGLVSVYQEPALIPDLDIRANLRLTETPVEPFRHWLGELGLTKLDLSAMAGRLPLASLRIIDLARALAIEPDVLMLDEMTAALPANLTERVLAVIGAQRGGDRSVIFISHRMIEIAAVCDRATVLREGETVGVVDVTAGSEEKIVELMLGQIAKAMPAIAERTAEHSTEARTPRISVRGLASGTKLKDATFDLYPGEVLGVVALDGQGQDELFDVLAGSDRPSGGELHVDGAAVTFRHPADAIRAGLVYVAADRAEALLMQRSVRENIALPFVSRLRTWGWIDLKSEGRTVNEAVARLQVDARAGNEVRRLSGGNQQKVTIARWVAGGVRTMLCFDPTRGIDIRTKQQIYVLLRDLAEAGAAVLLYTSELKEIQLVCDRSIVIFGGQVVEEIAGTDADEATLLRAAYHLRSGAQLPEELVAAGTAEAAGTATSTPPGAAEAVEAAEVASPVDEGRAAERPGQAAVQATEPADVIAPAPADPAQHRDEAGS